MTITDEGQALQEQAANMLAATRRQIADIEHATERARKAGTLNARAARLADLFGDRAGAWQSKAMRRSIGLHLSRLRHADLAGRVESLRRAAGGGLSGANATGLGRPGRSRATDYGLGG